jgi:hypothetical protein
MNIHSATWITAACLVAASSIGFAARMPATVAISPGVSASSIAVQPPSPIVPPAAIDRSAWSAHASRVLAQQEYHFAPVRGADCFWSAPSRAHGFRSRISASGIEIVPRDAQSFGASAEWQLSIATESFGRGERCIALVRAAVSANDERVELDHGALSEWFVNEPRGLEQGWTIARSPAGVGPLWICLAFGGDLRARIDASGRSMTLVDETGRTRLRYSDLSAFDASGRALDARLKSHARGVRVTVDDDGAVYPVTIDPVLTGPAWSTESDQAGALFGLSVASAGDVNGDGFSDVIVGAPSFDGGETDEGRAFVYLGSASGLSATADWTAEVDQAGAQFGVSVATAGDVDGDGFSDVIVGAETFEDGDETDEGGAFLYLGSASGLATSASWTGESNQDGALYGHCVATAGDVNGDGYSDVIVGASAYDNGETDEGRALVYFGSGAGLFNDATWITESDQASAFLGESVSTAGDVNGDGFDDVVVGAARYSNGELEEGRAFVHLGSASGLSTSADWTAESDQASAWFGESVATAGDVNGDSYSDVIVGAPSFDNGETDEGRSFVYFGSSLGLSVGADWTAESDQAGALFGASVATAGDVNGDSYSDVVLGAPAFTNGESSEGEVLVYLGSSTGLAASPAWTVESDQALARLGATVAIAGDVDGDGYTDVIVGAAEYDDVEVDEGRAFVFFGTSAGLDTNAAWSAESDAVGAFLGQSVANAGDVNGDGFSDVIVGAPGLTNGHTNEGRAYAYLGSAAGLSTSPAWTVESNQINAQFGFSVAGAGDVNGDGFSDVLVSAIGFDNGQTNEGRVFLYLGSSTGLATVPAWTAESNQAFSQFGFSAASAGDVNGDGLSDVIIGSYLYDDGESDEGRVSLYYGSAFALSATPAWTAASDQVDAWFGYSVASAGDVDRDGFGDVIIGSIAYDNGEANEGRAFVYLGSSSGLGASPAWTVESDQAGAQLGHSVATAGDVNGDGYSDVILGSNQYDNGSADEGRAFVYLGSSTGLATSPAWTAESDQSVAQFGRSVSTAGDVNNDGYSDVIVGSGLYDGGHTDEGRAFVYEGSATGIASSPSWIAEPNQFEAFFGWSVATAGDVNGDGFGDVIVGAWGFHSGQASEGQVRSYLGNEGRGGWTLAAQQRTVSDAAPIDLLGGSNAGNRIRIRLGFERTIAGFSWSSSIARTATLEWELRPLRFSLDGSDVESGAALPITGSPLVLNEIAELTSDGQVALPIGIVHAVATGSFHWRARVRTTSPLFPVTPWVTMPWNNDTESKLRVGPIPAVREAR